MNELSHDFVSDIRNDPLYPLSEAARIAQVPPSTLRTWFPGTHGKKLSFLELVEAYTIQKLRSRHHLGMPEIAQAWEYLRKKTRSPHPFALEELGFESDGVDLFITELGKLVSASEHGQIAMREFLDVFLQRVEHDEDGLAVRFFPFTRDFRTDSPKIIVVDPTLNFGRPCIARRAIPTAMIARRYKAGESAKDLADDYGCKWEEIEEAIRTELETSARAA